MSLTKCALGIRRIPNLLYSRTAMYSSESDVRAAGGSFATKEKAQEDQYFRKLQQEQLKNLKGHLDEEVSHHEEEIKRHQDQIKRLKEKAKKLDK